VPLFDEHSGMVDGLSHTSLENKSLEAALEKVFHGESHHIIELVLALFQKPIPIQPPQKHLTLKNTALVRFVKGEKHSSSIMNATQSILNPPEFPLGTEPILSDKLQLGIQTFLLIRTPWLFKSFPIYMKTKNKYLTSIIQNPDAKL
jgi:hypothetical protein